MLGVSPGAARRRTDGRPAERAHRGERLRSRILADDQDAVPPEAGGGVAHPSEPLGAHPATSPRWVDHSADFGLLARGAPGVADHVIAAHGEKVNRTLEFIAFVELDLQIERVGCLARPPEVIDAHSIPAAEASPPGDAPVSHGEIA